MYIQIIKFDSWVPYGKSAENNLDRCQKQKQLPIEV